MAQERGRLRGRLAGRYGLACGIMAALAACALLVGATLLGGLGGAPVTIERAPQGAAAGPAEDDEPKEDAEPEERDEVEEEPITEAAAVVVHVDGAVAAPGVYVLPEGSRATMPWLPRAVSSRARTPRGSTSPRPSQTARRSTCRSRGRPQP